MNEKFLGSLLPASLIAAAPLVVLGVRASGHRHLIPNTPPAPRKPR